MCVFDRDYVKMYNFAIYFNNKSTQLSENLKENGLCNECN